MLGQIEYKQNKSVTLKPENNFLEQINSVRLQATLALDKSRRSSLGQFFTPLTVSQMMSSMVSINRQSIQMLDAGAGMGILTAAFVASVCERSEKPKEITVTAVEMDSCLIPFLRQTFEYCRKECEQNGIKFTAQIYNEDFVVFAANNLSEGLFATPNATRFNLAILNPPYGKINTNSHTSQRLRRHGIITPNLYTAFLALSAEMLTLDGELVAITPRSFCNGTYFKPFRQYFLDRMSFRRFHVFDSRKKIFDDDILQENIIFHAVKGKTGKESDVVISTSRSGVEDNGDLIRLKNKDVVRPGDEDIYIHLGAEDTRQNNVEQLQQFQSTLEDLGLKVSTGRVVDFRAKEFLQNGLNENAAPLIYPHNMQNGLVKYPVSHKKKFNSIQTTAETESLLVTTGTYVLVKRFSAKEEKKRITASLFDPKVVPSEKIGFENHLNYFHGGGQGIDSKIARGLTLYLNSSLLDAYFRRFSGHTQVNATDLRYLKYPSREQLESLGAHFTDGIPTQEEIDYLINQIMLNE